MFFPKFPPVNPRLVRDAESKLARDVTPFIIGAQGDQLNKFVREPLDYFSRSDEWTDYVELVTGPVKNSLNWEESALNELFSVTNGHPYYTKLLSAKVFSTAVAQRDTEIIASDIRHALNSRISELDTNAFAHFLERRHQRGAGRG